jgi:hypothetical protein
VAGAVANTAGRGGDTWHRLHWVLGLRRLGFHVHLVERLDRAACVDTDGQPASPAASRNVAYFREIAAAFDLETTATLLDERGATLYGLPLRELRAVVDDAEALINISGHVPWRALGLRPGRTVFVDEDPGFTQMWEASGVGSPDLRDHDWHFTVGANLGRPGCVVPTCGLEWQPLLPFAVLDEWPAVPPAELDRFTTVGSWRGPCAALEFEGRTYGVKAHEFRRFLPLPARAGQPFELALDIDPCETTDLALLRAHGWHLVDPARVAAGPRAFREYVQGAGAEFSVAKEMYVAAQSGWFSDRSVRYLATGRPVLVQDTGFTHRVPAGEGLVTVRTLEEATDGARRIARDYAGHCAAARAIARAHFDSDVVLGELLDKVGVGAHA